MSADRMHEAAHPPDGQDPSLIGEKLRLRRKQKRLSIKQVSEKSGISIGMLSLVERGRSMPSVRSMRAICDALEMPVRWLFENDFIDGAYEDDIVVRAGARRSINYDSHKLHKELLTPDTQADIQMLRFVLQPGSDSGEPYKDAPGGKCGLVLRGRLGLELGGRSFIIEVGDSFAFDATQSVRFWCIGAEECEVIWVVAPPTV